jgi:triosephosphate isomerase
MSFPHWPELIINLKQIVTGERISKYVVTAAELARSYRHPLIVCVNNAEIHEAVDSLTRKDPSLFDFFHIFGQSIDPVAPGASWTGSTTPRALANLGAHGTLINHYEDRIYGHNPGKRQKQTGEVNNKPEDFEFLKDTILAGLDAGLNLVICADGPKTASEIAGLLTSQELKDQIYRNFVQKLLDTLTTKSYVEFERIFGRFPEGLSRGSFKQGHFPNIFFGLLTREDSQQSYDQFKTRFNLYQTLLKDSLSSILLDKLKEEFYNPVINHTYNTIAIAVEWDEFIGKGISIVREKPEIIKDTVAAVNQINPSLPVYCGAGVETAQDIITAIRDCGAVGSLAASAFATPFREKIWQESSINWQESISWQEAVERYLKEISEYQKLQRPLEEKDIYNKIFLIREDYYGLKVQVAESDSQKLVKLLMRPAYYQAPIQVKVRGEGYQELTPSLIPKLINEPIVELHMYGKGTKSFSFMRKVLDIIDRRRKTQEVPS